MVAVIGESGVGKSTLLNIIAGLEPFDAGYVGIDATDIGALDDDSRTLLRRNLVGFVFQAFHLLPYLNVAENVAVPLRLLGWPKGVRNDRILEVLTDVGLDSRAGARPRELSGGELQRVAIARALVHRPRLLLADEPTGNLDTVTAEEILSLLVREVRRNRAAGLMVTHSARAAAHCDRVVRIADGVARPATVPAPLSD
jgi:putative ABC transport system ATP-binding protein